MTTTPQVLTGPMAIHQSDIEEMSDNQDFTQQRGVVSDNAKDNYISRSNSIVSTTACGGIGETFSTEEQGVSV